MMYRIQMMVTFLVFCLYGEAHESYTNPPDVIKYGDGWILGDLTVVDSFLRSDGANFTVLGSVPNLATTQSNYKIDDIVLVNLSFYKVNSASDWEVISGSGGSSTSAADLNVIMVTDTVDIGENYYQFTLRDWDQADASYYSKRFKRKPYVRIGSRGTDSELTDYGTFLVGATVGSHRAVRYNLAEGVTFTGAWQIYLFAVLDSVTGIVISDINATGGLAFPHTIITAQMGRRIRTR